MEPSFEPQNRRSAPRKTDAEPLPSAVDFSDLDRITEDHLDFSAITDGLGFHPRKRVISDKAPTDFDDDIPPAASAQAPAAPKPNPISAEEISAAIRSSVAPKTETPAAKAPAASTAPSPSPQLNETPAIAFASASERALAFAVDFTLVFAPLWGTFFWTFAGNLGLIADNFILTLGFSFVVLFSYLLISEGLCGQSLGKMLLGIVVVEDDKFRKPVTLTAAGLRIVGFVAGLAAFGLGPLAALWDSKSRAWHDRLALSIVEKKPEE